ncbi:MAG: endolytic transglycosylase MltG [Methanoregulaceae archaeon]|nr:endolytic transglycosylase MltG [Methanoregulaceae archaeon]
MSKRTRNVILIGLGLVLGCAIGAVMFVKNGIEPLAPGEPYYVRYDSTTKLSQIADELAGKVVRHPNAFLIYARYRKNTLPVSMGTYQIRSGMTADELLAALRKPIQQMVRIPETNFSFRTARLLEQKEVTTEQEYLEWMKKPEEFAQEVDFPLPDGNLEGFLFPDTYDLPPLLGAKAVIRRQLQAFEKKILPLLPNEKTRMRTLIIASMVELEAGVDDERAVIAGVIENRVSKKMRLQIDATVLYGMREWRRLFNKDYRHDSPYNTYRIDGLPPGPICSPSVASVKAALKPAKHEWLYYVALPNRRHLFAKTYEDHLRNVARARKLRDGVSP